MEFLPQLSQPKSKYLGTHIHQTIEFINFNQNCCILLQEQSREGLDCSGSFYLISLIVRISEDGSVRTTTLCSIGQIAQTPGSIN